MNDEQKTLEQQIQEIREQQQQEIESLKQQLAERDKIITQFVTMPAKQQNDDYDIDGISKQDVQAVVDRVKNKRK